MLYALGVFGRLCRLFAEDSLEQNLTVRSLLGLSGEQSQLNGEAIG